MLPLRELRLVLICAHVYSVKRPTGAGWRTSQVRRFSLGGLTNLRTSIAVRFERPCRTPAFYDMRGRASITILKETIM